VLFCVFGSLFFCVLFALRTYRALGVPCFFFLRFFLGLIDCTRFFFFVFFTGSMQHACSGKMKRLSVISHVSENIWTI
jgi:hypothetical protein